MRRTIFFSVMFAMLVALLMLFLVDSVFAEEEVTQEISSVSLTLLPSQERIPRANEPSIAPELFVPPISSRPSSEAQKKADETPVIPSANFSPFSAPLISGLESGKWYIQIGAYKRAGHVEEAISRVGTASPVVIHNAGTDTNPMFRVLLGPFSRNESKTMLQRFKNNGYEAFERNG
jgi:cell division septation protein DedD